MAFRHLLVPLDGSPLSEAALSAARELAASPGIRVTLLHVLERRPPETIHGEPHLGRADEAVAYLNAVAARAFPPGVPVTVHVHEPEVDDVAPSLARHAAELGVDLIVLSAHGRGGLRGWLVGRIAEQVVARGTTPTLLIHPDGDAAALHFSVHRLLVPLDGSPQHEQGLTLALALAAARHAEVILLTVVQTATTLTGSRAAAAVLLPGTTAELLDMTEAGARDYLAAQVSRMEAMGLKGSARVERGDPAEAIAAAAEGELVDVIVLATHGKIGLDAFSSGSVSPRVASRTRVPLLLTRVIPLEANGPGGA